MKTAKRTFALFLILALCCFAAFACDEEEPAQTSEEITSDIADPTEEIPDETGETESTTGTVEETTAPPADDTTTAHVHAPVSIPAVAATCTEAGKTEGSKCSECNEIISAQQDVPALGHTEVIDAAVAATCTAEGKTEGKHCSVCNAVTVAQQTVAKAAHTEIVDAAVEPTCTKSGNTQGTHCGVCELVLVASNVIPAAGHTEENLSSIAPTCTSTGKTEGKKCSVCNAITVKQTTIPKLNHTYSSKVTAPTCEEQGYTTHTCTACFDQYIDKYVKAIGHTWKGWEQSGSNVLRYCSNNCGKYQRVMELNASYNGIRLLTGESVIKEDVKLVATLSDGSNVSVSNFTLKNEVMKIDGMNDVTVKFYSLTTTVSVPAIPDNLPNTTNRVEFTYTNKNDAITITGFIGSSKDIVIPAHINRVPVRYIAKEAFQKKGFTSVAIPPSIYTIGEYAFNGCSYLSNLTLHEGLTTINGGAFMNTAIQKLTIPNSVKKINTKSYSVAGSGNIHDGAFENCKKLTYVKIGNGVTNIGLQAFANCSSIENLVIGNSLETIDKYTFYGCTSLKNITFGSSIKTIGSYAFQGCASLESINIPGNVEIIGKYTFQNCTSLKSVTFNDGLEGIYGGAFMNTAIQRVTIPNSVKNIYTESYSVAGSGNIHDGAFENCKKLTYAKIGNGVTNIGLHAFANCSSIETLVIGNNVETIEQYAFYGCSSLKNITYGIGLKTIGSYAFQGCTSLESINIPGNVERIGKYTFQNCTSLKSVTFNEGLKEIYGGAFMNTAIINLTIPNSVEKIHTESYSTAGSGNHHDGAFENCSKLTSIIIGSGLKTLNRETFANCKALVTVKIPDNVENIHQDAFKGCTSLKLS